jgi:hypothetical protein
MSRLCAMQEHLHRETQFHNAATSAVILQLDTWLLNQSLDAQEEVARADII